MSKEENKEPINPVADYLKYCNMWTEFYLRNFALPWTQLFNEVLQNKHDKESKKD